MPKLSSTQSLIVFLALLLTGVGLIAFNDSDDGDISAVGIMLVISAITMAGVKGAVGGVAKIREKQNP